MMERSDPELSVIIPAFNEEGSIGECLRSLALQTVGRPYEVVLVDNNCTNDTLRIARESGSGLDLHAVRETRQGRGAARRAGFAAARGAILFSADADTR